jgi:hypothetical protein
MRCSVTKMRLDTRKAFHMAAATSAMLPLVGTNSDETLLAVPPLA